MNADTKPLILCADDYAHDAGVSQAVLALARATRLSATSAMVLSPRWPRDAAPLAELRGAIDVGLHLDWTSPFARAAGHGLSLPAAMARAGLGGFDRSAARVVIERQLDAFEAVWRAPPDHVDGHQHVQQFAGIREPLVDLLTRRYGAQAPWLRLSRAPAGQRDAKARLIAAMGADATEKIASAAGLMRAAWLSGMYGFDGDEAAYGRRMAHWLASAPAASVLMCHPGAADAAGAPRDAIAAARQREARYLASPAFGAALAAARVRLARGRACLQGAGGGRP